MGILTWLLQLLTIALALALGCSIAKAGVLTGRAIGAFDVQLGRWRVVWQTYQFRPDKVYYQAVVLAA